MHENVYLLVILPHKRDIDVMIQNINVFMFLEMRDSTKLRCFIQTREK
jgi:hypothetical protein